MKGFVFLFAALFLWLSEAVAEQGFYNDFEEDTGLSSVDDDLSFEQIDYDEAGRMKRQIIFYPTPTKETRRSPLVVISHGNGHRYKYYKYLQKYLADKGFVVMSHYNNTGPGIRTAAETTLENTDEFIEKVNSLAEGALAGRVDTSRIAWIGHSRGGEGVVLAYNRLLEGSFIPKNYSADSIKFISSIAPTTFLPANEVNPHKVPYHMFVGGADGDVDGSPRKIVMSMPIYERAQGEKVLTYVQGAGHNVFNDQSWDEGYGPDRLKRDKVHEISREVYAQLLEIYLNGKTELKKNFWSNWAVARAPGVPTEPIISNEFKFPEDSSIVWVLDDFQVSNTFKGILQDKDQMFLFFDNDPMNGMTRHIDSDRAPQGLIFDWDGSDAALEYELYEAKDFTDFEALTFRAAQGSRHPLTTVLDQPINFSVRLMNEDGTMAWVNTKEFGDVNIPYPRDGGWANEFSIFRIPLEAFVENNSELELSQISRVDFLFGENFGSEKGRMAIDDIQFVKSEEL